MLHSKVQIENVNEAKHHPLSAVAACRNLKSKKTIQRSVTINVPVVYMAPDIMILMGEIHFEGHWKGWALKIETSLGPEIATSEANAIWYHFYTI
jgi:hypothetical protein